MPKVIFFFLLVNIGIMYTNAQIKFTDRDTYIKVIKNQVVEIKADTAFVMNKGLVEYFNTKALELTKVQIMHNNQIETNKTLKKELDRTLKLIDELITKIEDDSALINQVLNTTINDLKNTINTLDSLNNAIAKTNSDLKTQNDVLTKLNKKLKKATRGIWWDGVTDKIVAGSIGLVVGVGACLILVATGAL
jgi:hypothetical protein